MMKISIGFSKSTKKFSPVSWLIRLIEGTEYSHVYIRRNSKYGEYVYQASGTQVNFMSLDTFLSHNEICEEYEFNIPEELHDEVISFCIKHAGKPYGSKQLLLMGAARLGFKIKGDGNNTFVCSEIGEVFVNKFLQIDVDEEQDLVTPKILHTYIAPRGRRVV